MLRGKDILSLIIGYGHNIIRYIFHLFCTNRYRYTSALQEIISFFYAIVFREPFKKLVRTYYGKIIKGIQIVLFSLLLRIIYEATY